MWLLAIGRKIRFALRHLNSGNGTETGILALKKSVLPRNAIAGSFAVIKCIGQIVTLLMMRLCFVL